MGMWAGHTGMEGGAERLHVGEAVHAQQVGVHLSAALLGLRHGLWGLPL